MNSFDMNQGSRSFVSAQTFKKLSKSEDISEDEIKDLEDALQKLTDKYIANVDKAVEEKTKEILTV